MLLEAVGVSASEENVYRFLLTRPRATRAEITRALGIEDRTVRRALESLEARGLVSQIPGKPRRYIPAPPDVAIEALVHQRQEQLERTRLAAVKLKSEFVQSAQLESPIELVEVLTGRDAVAQRFELLQRSARDEVLVFDTPPYAVEPGLNEVQIEMMQRGVRYRAVYDRDALEVSGQWDLIKKATAAGEESRVVTKLPMKLAIADDALALVPLNMTAPGLEGAVLVHPSSLLDALIHLFETTWENAVSVTFLSGKAVTGEAAEPTEDEKRLLGLLSAGFKDETLARHMGIGIRTLRRRLRALMNKLGVETRFQAGVQASKRGWL